MLNLKFEDHHAAADLRDKRQHAREDIADGQTSSTVEMASAFSSQYASSTTLLASSAVAPPHLDLGRLAPSALNAAVRKRAFRGELILFSFDFCGISEALSLVLTLRRIGFEHFAPMSDGPETCEAMRQAATARGISPLWPCWYSSWPRDHPGWQQWGTAPGCVSAARSSRTCVLEQLWASRYHVAAQILATGVNLLHVDTDSVFLSDPYELLKRPPLSHTSLLILPETPANGGMWYAQNTSKGTGAAWIIAEVARRTLRVIDLPLARGKKGLPPFDQAMLGDVLFTAADRGRLHWGAACEHPHLKPTPLCQPANITTGARGMKWTRRMKLHAPSEAMAASVLPLAPTSTRHLPPPRAASSRLVDDATHLPKTPFRMAELHVAGKERVELAAAAPPWLFPSAWKAQQLGLYSRSPPAMSVVHLLGTRCRWCESSEDVDHGAKWEWMHLSGMWPERAYILAPPLNATNIAATFANSSPPKLLRSDGSSDGDVERTLAQHVEKNCHKRGRARLLYADRPVLRLASGSESLRRAEVADDGGALAQALIRRLLLLASFTGRMAVLPSFNCSAPWITKRYATDGFMAVTDLRVVVVDVTDGRPVHEQRCAPCNVQFACREHVLSEAQHAAMRALRAAEGEPRTEMPLALPLRPRVSTKAATRAAASAAAAAAVSAAATAEAAGAAVGAAIAKAAGEPVVDLPLLWAKLLIPLPPVIRQYTTRASPASTAPTTGDSPPRVLGDVPELTVSEVADVEGDGCSIDTKLLREARPIAARVAQLHCGVADTMRNLRAECPRTAAAVGTELRSWSKVASYNGRLNARCAKERSPLARRLSARCYDLLCSTLSCFEHSVRACIARIEEERRSKGGLSSSMLRERCEAWVRHLPVGFGPQCDALTGQCITPPEAHAGAVMWPSAACLEHGGRAMCEAPAVGGALVSKGASTTECMACAKRG